MDSIPKGILPRVVECDEVIGGVCKAAAEETGLRPGTPVLGGAVDGAAASLEGGVFNGGDAVEMSGTSSVLLVGTDEKVDKLLPENHPGTTYFVIARKPL